MMSRRFTTRERVLLLVLILLFTATLYVLAIFNPTTKSIEDARNQRVLLEADFEVEMIKAGELVDMRASLQKMENSGNNLAMIPGYDNISNIAPLLNAAFTRASEYDLRFMPITFSDNFAVREILIMFTAGSYSVAENIVEELSAGPYSCDISALKIAGVDSENTDVTSGEVEISLTITYYEVVQSVAVAYGDDGI